MSDEPTIPCGFQVFHQWRVGCRPDELADTVEFLEQEGSVKTGETALAEELARAYVAIGRAVLDGVDPAAAITAYDEVVAGALEIAAELRRLRTFAAAAGANLQGLE